MWRRCACAFPFRCNIPFRRHTLSATAGERVAECRERRAVDKRDKGVTALEAPHGKLILVISLALSGSGGLRNTACNFCLGSLCLRLEGKYRTPRRAYIISSPSSWGGIETDWGFCQGYESFDHLNRLRRNTKTTCQLHPQLCVFAHNGWLPDGPCHRDA